MKQYMLLFFGFLWVSACVKQDQDVVSADVFLGSDRKEVTIGYVATRLQDRTVDQISSKDYGNETEQDLALFAAIDYINSSRIFPFKMNIKVIEFHGTSPKEIAKGIKQFRQNVNTVAVWVGTKVQEINEALSEASVDRRVPIFYPINSKSLLTQGYPNVYQTTPSNTTYGYSIFEIAKRLGLHNIIIVKDSSEFYSSEWVESFKNLNNINHDPIHILDTIAGKWTHDSEESIKARIRESLIKNPSFDAVFFPGRHDNVDSLLGLLQELNIKTTVLAGDEGSYTSVFANNKGLNDVYYPSFFPSLIKPENNPKTADIIKAYYKFYNSIIINNLAAAQHYFAAGILVAEIIAKVMGSNNSIQDSDTFYDVFNNTAKANRWATLMDDPPFRFGADGSTVVRPSELYLNRNSKREGVVTVGQIGN